jgi:eukaryotic-like serine/threonine-protein kinase
MTTPSEIKPTPPELRKKYRVIAKLGEGGMAHIHLAVALGVGGVRKLVVLKSIRPELVAVADERMREMFLTEARLAATFNHPNIVQTFEVAVFGGRPVLVMEYLEGQSLASILRGERRWRVPLPVQLYVLKEVLNGLDYVHNITDLDGTELNLVHRDISPPNVFVTYEGHIKILDFGIAKNIRSGAHTETGVIKGKIRYMAPEQFVGAAVDRRTDLFAVGVLLWEALTGKRLWEGVQEVQIMRKLLDGDVPSPSAVVPKVAPRLESICKKALLRDCNDRYESATAMQIALEAAIEELGLGTNHRQVGKFVSEMFAERRSKTKIVLEQQLREEEPSAVSFVISDECDAQSTEDGALSADLWGLPTDIALGPSTTRKRGRRRTLIPLASTATVALAISIAALGALTTRSHDKGRASVQATMDAPAARRAGSTVPSAIAGATAASAPDGTGSVHGSVRVSIRATPPRARLFFDDVLLAGNPFDAEMPGDPGPHSVRAEAVGYRSQTLTVTLAGPLALNVDLQRAVAVPFAERAAPSDFPSASSDRLCKPPFYFDRKGIKYYRPECLK